LWKRPLKRWLELTVEEIVAAVGKFRQRRVVITGGEPLMHDLRELSRELLKANYAVQLETSGTKLVAQVLPEIFLTVSPKIEDHTTYVLQREALQRANEIIFPVTRTDSLSRLQQLVVPLLKRATPVYLHVIGNGVLASKAAAAAFAHDYFLAAP
jgi:7-carboxy-7-deazaguanine synthase